MILAYNCDFSARLQDSPGTFASLMDLYERNYIGLRRLIPVMPPAQTHLLSQAPNSLSLHLKVIERFRYTSELSLTYHFVKDTGVVAEPNLRIRIYHDAQMAEVMSAQLRHWPDFKADEESEILQLRSRWRANRFLYKWLNYCLYQRHRFGSII